MIAAVQHIRILMRHGDRQPTANVQALQTKRQHRLRAIGESIVATLQALYRHGCCMCPWGFIAGRDLTGAGNAILAPA